jgi:hypothetical protein
MADIDLIKQYQDRKDADFNAWIAEPSTLPTASSPKESFLT